MQPFLDVFSLDEYFCIRDYYLMLEVYFGATCQMTWHIKLNLKANKIMLHMKMQ